MKTKQTKEHLKPIMVSIEEEINFWELIPVGSSLKLEVKSNDFERFLKQQKIWMSPFKSKFPLIRIVENIVYELTKVEFKSIINQYFNERIKEGKNKDYEIVINKLKGSSQYFFSINRLEFMSEFPMEKIHMKDPKDKSYCFYKNTIVEVSRKGVKTINYKDFDMLVLEKRIINREFNLISSNLKRRESMFYKFLINVCGKNKERMVRMKGAIGYLLHTYKDPSFSKAICFIDENASLNQANGGSGKSLLALSIGYIRKAERLDGKTFDVKSKFRFGGMSIHTDVIDLDDLKKKFNFKKLFSSITSGLDIEKKFKDQEILDYKSSPKMMISSNYDIMDDGGFSELRRQEVIEFSDYYGKEMTPKEEFGMRFFDDWDEREWNLFDNFMMRCTQKFLKNGIKGWSSTTKVKRRLIRQTNKEFYEWAESYKWKDDKIETKKLHNEYKEIFREEELTQTKFNKFVTKYLEQHKYVVNLKPQGGKQFFVIREKR